MISVLLPTRKRPAWLKRAVESAFITASGPIEIVLYIDQDDGESVIAADQLAVNYVIGPRIVLSDCWNKCLAAASGDIYMMGGDDMLFRTPGWDIMVESVFSESDDKILMVHGDDGANGNNFAAFPTIHARWVEAIGYFAPPYFVGDCADSWLNDVANDLGRRRYIPFTTEHLHPLFGKALSDATYNERKDRELRDNPTTLYDRLLPERLRDVEKLRAIMERR